MAAGYDFQPQGFDASYFQFVPSSLYGLINGCYRRRCKTHNVILSNEDLKEHSIVIDWSRLLRDAQHKKRRSSVNKAITSLTKLVLELGEPFASKAHLGVQPTSSDSEDSAV